MNDIICHPSERAAKALQEAKAATSEAQQEFISALENAALQAEIVRDMELAHVGVKERATQLADSLRKEVQNLNLLLSRAP